MYHAQLTEMFFKLNIKEKERKQVFPVISTFYKDNS